MKFENIYKETEENMRLALLSLWAPGNHPMRPAINELFDRNHYLEDKQKMREELKNDD